MISKIATLIEFLIGQGKQMTWVFVEAQATQFQSQRDDELRKKDGKVVFASRQTGNILNASTYGPYKRGRCHVFVPICDIFFHPRHKTHRDELSNKLGSLLDVMLAQVKRIHPGCGPRD